MNFLKNRSLSFKLVLLFVATAIAMFIVLRLMGSSGFIKDFGRSLQPHFKQYAHYISQEVGNPPNLQTAKKLSEKLNIKIIIRGVDMQWSSDGSFFEQLELQTKFKIDNKRQFQGGFNKGQFLISIPNEPYLMTFISNRDDTVPSPRGVLLSSLLGVLLVLALLYYLLRRMIHPIKNIQTGVKRIGSGDLGYRIRIQRHDELGELSQEINGMVDDIENMLEAKRQLLLAISHELRSPITRAKVATSLLDKSKIKESLDADLTEMETMVAGLLEAELLNSRHQSLNLTGVDINTLISGVIDKHFSKESTSQASVIFNADNSLESQQIDEARFQFIIKNIIENALKYRKNEDDKVMISTVSEKDSYKVIVEDKGIGITEEHLSHISEPFYRVDPSRHRKTGGYGLGLYITKMIVQAHQGELLLESKEGLGTKIIILIPYSK